MTDISNTNWMSMSDHALIEHIATFIKHHRLEQNRSQEEVATAAGISRSTLSMLERGKTVTINTLIRVLRVLNLLYVIDIFKINTQISPIELAKIEQEKRKRARSKSNDAKRKSNW